MRGGSVRTYTNSQNPLTIQVQNHLTIHLRPIKTPKLYNWNQKTIQKSLKPITYTKLNMLISKKFAKTAKLYKNLMPKPLKNTIF